MEITNRTLWWIVGGLVVVIACLVGFVLVYTLYFQPQTVEPLPNIDTVVAATLSAYETQNPPTNTPVSTSVPPNTNTPLPTRTATVVPTATPTRTPFPSPSVTMSPDDPREILGPPTWKDEFKSASNWTLFDDACFQTRIENDKFIMNSKTAPSATCWEVTWPRIADFYLETIARTTDECSKADRYGMIFRAPDPSQGYLFGYTCDGRYAMARWDPEEKQWDWLVDFEPSDLINVGPNQVNRIGVMANGDRYGLYINGSLVDEVEDDRFTESGLFGYFIGAAETIEFTVEYDEIAYWNLN